jgi:hypothetical protein
MQLRLSAAVVNGNPKLSVWIMLLEPHDGFAGNGAEIVLDLDAIPGGLVPGRFQGLSCGHGQQGTKWGLSGGRPREMLITSTGEATHIYINQPKLSIVVRTADLREAERYLGLGPHVVVS